MFQVFQILPSRSAILNFLYGYYAKQEQFAQTVARAMPAQTIAARTCWQAILRCLCATFIPLDNVVYFPVSIRRLGPAAILKLNRVAAKMAVPARLVEYCAQLAFMHSTSDLSQAVP